MKDMEARYRIPETYDKILSLMSKTLRAENSISEISEKLGISYANAHSCIMDMVDDKVIKIHANIAAGQPEWIDDAFVRVTTRGQRLILEEGGYKHLTIMKKQSESATRIFRRGTILNAILFLGLGAWQAFETSDSNQEEQRDVAQDVRLIKNENEIKQLTEEIETFTSILDSIGK